MGCEAERATSQVLQDASGGVSQNLDVRADIQAGELLE